MFFEMAASYFCVILCGLPVVWCQSDCDTAQVIGNNDNTEYTEATESMVYLNLNNPAQCNGTISSYQYCQYPTVQTANIRFNAILAVFRKVGNTYQPVNGSDFVVEVGMTLPFICRNATPSAGSVQIQPGDVLGACVGRRQGNPNNRQQLNLAGNNASRFSVSGASIDECNTMNLQDSLTVMVDDLTNISERILHLSAEFTPTTVPPPIDPSASSGSPNPTPTSTLPTSPTGGGGNSNAAGVAVGAAVGIVFFLLFLTAVIIVAIIIFKRFHSTGSSTIRKVTTSSTEDPSLQTEQPGVNTFSLKSNDAYAMATSTQTVTNTEFGMMSNEAYTTTDAAAMATSTQTATNTEFGMMSNEAYTTLDNGNEYAYVI